MSIAVERLSHIRLIIEKKYSKKDELQKTQFDFFNTFIRYGFV